MKIEYIDEEEREFPKIGLVRKGIVRDVNEEDAQALIQTGRWQKVKPKKSRTDSPKLGLEISGLGKDVDEELKKILDEGGEE